MDAWEEREDSYRVQRKDTLYVTVDNRDRRVGEKGRKELCVCL